MATGLFGVGISGLSAAQAGLVTTGHNIANASTPGFHRQEVVQSNPAGMLTGGGFIGRGVSIETVRRVYSDVLETQVSRSEAQASYYTTYANQVGRIDDMLGDPSTGLAPELQRFFEGVNALSANSASVPARQTMLSSAGSLVASMRSLDARIVEINRGANVEVESTVLTVNSYAKQIASLNDRITVTAGGAQQPPNDLLDQRERLISELNKLVGATTVTQPDGGVNVSIGSGQSLVVGNQAFQLAAVRSPDTPDRTDVNLVIGSSSIAMPTQTMGGSLGAVLAFRAGALTTAQNQLGRIAAGLAITFNEQHALGQDLTGAAGANFFAPPVSQVTARTGNAGTADITASITNVSALQASSYRLLYTGGAYELTRLSDNTTTSFAALPQTVDGFSLTLAGGTAPANGDSFLIEPATHAARDIALAISDPARIAAAAPMRTMTGTANGGNAAISPGVVNAPRDANLQATVTITFTSPTTFDVTGAGPGNTGVPYTSGQDITYNGWTVQIAGAPAAGDTFSVVSNTNGAADNRNAALLADLQLAKTLGGGTVSYQDAYGQLTSSVGNTAQQMNIAAEAQDMIALRSRQAQQSVSGVNLDEEAANLLRYQQAYQASGKVIEVASTLFDTILSLGT